VLAPVPDVDDAPVAGSVASSLSSGVASSWARRSVIASCSASRRFTSSADGSLDSREFGAVSCLGLGIGLLAGPLHGVDDYADDHVEQDESRNDNEGDEVDPRLGLGGKRRVLDLVPTLHRHELEHCQQSAADVAPVGGIDVREQDPAEHPINVEDHREKQG
jgi:hypothetical protein